MEPTAILAVLVAEARLRAGHISWQWRLGLVGFGLFFGGTGIALLMNWRGAARFHAISGNPWWHWLSGPSRDRATSSARWMGGPFGLIGAVLLIALAIHA